MLAPSGGILEGELRFAPHLVLGDFSRRQRGGGLLILGLAHGWRFLA